MYIFFIVFQVFKILDNKSLASLAENPAQDRHAMMSNSATEALSNQPIASH